MENTTVEMSTKSVETCSKEKWEMAWEIIAYVFIFMYGMAAIALFFTMTRLGRYGFYKGRGQCVIIPGVRFCMGGASWFMFGINYFALLQYTNVVSSHFISYQHDIDNYVLLKDTIIASCVMLSGIVWFAYVEERALKGTLSRSASAVFMLLGIESIIFCIPLIFGVKMYRKRLHRKQMIPSKSKYAQKLFVKYFDNEEPVCPTCQTRFSHPDDAIVTTGDSKKAMAVPVEMIETLIEKKTYKVGDLDTCITPCGHSFHYGCLKLSVDRNELCPICRMSFVLKNCYVVPHNKNYVPDKDEDSYSIGDLPETPEFIALV